jgi:hypothetical protein
VDDRRGGCLLCALNQKNDGFIRDLFVSLVIYAGLWRMMALMGWVFWVGSLVAADRQVAIKG